MIGRIRKDADLYFPPRPEDQPAYLICTDPDLPLEQVVQ